MICVPWVAVDFTVELCKATVRSEPVCNSVFQGPTPALENVWDPQTENVENHLHSIPDGLSSLACTLSGPGVSQFFTDSHAASLVQLGRIEGKKVQHSLFQ